MPEERQPDRAGVAAALARQLRGAILQPGDAAYAVARRVWNGAIERRPAAIVRCEDAEDVAIAVRLAAEHDTPVTVRGGGHNVAGRAVADGALLIDLARMRTVTVDAAGRTAVAQGGALWHDLDLASAAHGLATTGGMISSTGVAGLTLGGGVGWLMRRHGLAIDNLTAAGVVLADGRFVRATAEEHEDLFYGLRGGAGGLGVVTSLEFRLHPLRQVLAGVVIRPASEARATLCAFRDFARQAPDEFCGMVVLGCGPPLPFLDAGWHGRPVVLLAVCWCGEMSTGERALEGLRRFGTVLADHVGPIPYVQWQHLQDGATPPGRAQYWKTVSNADLSDRTIDALAEAVAELPTRVTELHVQHLGGAVARVPHAETAFADRSAQFFVNLIGVTPWPEEFAQVREWVRQLHAQLTPEALPSMQPNFSNQDDGDVTMRFAADKSARLAAIRRRYDPAGLFAPSLKR